MGLYPINFQQITMTSLSLCSFTRFLQPTAQFSCRKPDVLELDKCRLIAYTGPVSIILIPLALHPNFVLVLHKWYARTYQSRSFDKQVPQNSDSSSPYWEVSGFNPLATAQRIQVPFCSCPSTRTTIYEEITTTCLN